MGGNRVLPQPRAKLRRRKKLLYAASTVVAFFLLLELGLKVAGVQPLYLTQDPFVGFQPGVPLFVREGDWMRTNPSKVCFFNVQRFPAEKGPNTYRVFCLGGSTTFGHPYDHRTAFGNWLQERLKDAAPDRNWEVINCGGISYASYRECLLMQELVRYQPDLFIICTGHNEFLEERTYGSMKSSWASRALGSVVARTRTGSVAASLLRPRTQPPDEQDGLLKAEVDTILERSVGPSAYQRDDERQRQVVEHFRYSLDRMCAIAQAAGARVIFVKPASNLRDFTPFKSQPGENSPDQQAAWEKTIAQARKDKKEGRLDDAVRGFLAAATIDPEHAEGLWEAGDALATAGRYGEAREYLVRAVDEDICPLRGTSAIQAAVVAAAKENGVPLVDLEEVLEAADPRPAGHRILGDESFLDHVHPTIEGHRLLAWALFDRLADCGVVEPRQSTPEEIGRVSGRVLHGIDARAHAMALVQVVQVLSWAGKNEEALRLTDRAEKTFPGLSEVRSYRGRILEKLGRDEEAIECFREAIRRNLDDTVAWSRLGYAHLRRNRFEAARTCFATALVRTPESAPLSFRTNLRMGMGITFAQLKQWDYARQEFEAVLRAEPQRTEAKEYLDAVRAELEKNSGSPLESGTK